MPANGVLFYRYGRGAQCRRYRLETMSRVMGGVIAARVCVFGDGAGPLRGFGGSLAA